VASIAIILLVC